MGNFDLDMSYITDRLVAMSFPSQHIRAVYRNPLWQVKRVLDTQHGSHYKVYNLCAEETYDPEYFDGRVEVIPFDDNHVPPLSLIKIFCESVHAWLSRDAQNVAVVHCMVFTSNFELCIHPTAQMAADLLFKREYLSLKGNQVTNFLLELKAKK